MRSAVFPFAIGLAGVFVAAGFLPVRAQGLGFKTGLVISNQGEGNDARRNLTFGLLANFPLDRGRFVPSVSIVPKGSQSATRFVGSSQLAVGGDPWYVSVQSDLHVTIPFGNASFYLLAAPRADFLIGVDGADGTVAPASELRYVQVLPYNSVVWGGAIGFGQDIEMSDHTFFLEVRYDQDLTPAREIQYGSFGSGESVVREVESVFNRAVMLQIGLRWGSSHREDRSTSEPSWPPVTPLN